MTKPKLSVVKNEVEVELTEADDPRLKGWRQAERFFCRADHTIIITDIEEYTSGGLVDSSDHLIVHLATRLPGEEPDPLPWPLWFRRENDVGRSGLHWFDLDASKRLGIESFAKWAADRRADPSLQSLDELDFQTLARVGLENRIAALAHAKSISAEDLMSLSDWAYGLGYSSAIADVKPKVEPLAAAGVGAIASQGSARARRTGKAEARKAIIVAIAVQIAANRTPAGITDWRREASEIIGDERIEPFLLSIRDTDREEVRMRLRRYTDKTIGEIIQGASPPIGIEVEGVWRPLAPTTNGRD